MSDLEKAAKLYFDADGQIEFTGKFEDAIQKGHDSVYKLANLLNDCIAKNQQPPKELVVAYLNWLDFANSLADRFA